MVQGRAGRPCWPPERCLLLRRWLRG